MRRISQLSLVVKVKMVARFYDVLLHKKNNFFVHIFTRVQCITDPRNTIFARVRTPGPSQDRRLWPLHPGMGDNRALQSYSA